MKKTTLIVATLAMATACTGGKPSTKPTVTSTLSSGIDLAGANTTVRPQDDFYEYVNGKWLAETELPSDRSDYGSFSKLSDEAEVQLKVIAEELVAQQNAAAGSAEAKIANYYQAYLEASDRAENDLTAVQPFLKSIDTIATHEDFYRVSGQLTNAGVRTPVSISLFSDYKNPDIYTVYLSQSGLTLRDRDYYLKDEPRFTKARDLYVTYANTVLGFGAFPPAGDNLLAFETKLAEISWTREQNRNPDKRYNPMSRADLLAYAAPVDWTGFLAGSVVPEQQTYVVVQKSYFEGLGRVLKETPLETLKSYLRFKVIASFASVLGKPGFEAQFEFARKGLRGVKEPRPVWKRAIGSMNWTIGELLGQIYVKRHFQGAAKTRMNAMVDQLMKAYGESIKSLEWMSAATKAEALQKLKKFRPKVGYPEKWIDYSDLAIGNDAVQNSINIREFELKREIAKLDKPVDKSEWGMPPQIVNAYFNPLWNEIVFPAAILQPPFFNLEADEAANYGAIGAVIGHELGHGFDDQGRKFDGDGVLRDWWTEEDAKKFDERKNALAKQFNAFKAIDDMTINGEFTSGENIGDLGGLSIAYKAYRMSLDGKEPPVIDGLTGDQRFFMGWAQVWRRLYTPEELKRRLVVDPHSPSKARTNVIVSNIPAFYDAFDVKEGDAMYLPPEERVKIW